MAKGFNLLLASIIPLIGGGCGGIAATQPFLNVP
jgi:hypothetical protein